MKAFLAVVAALLVLPGAALASTHPVIPVSNSGVDQYIETVPGASGPRATVNPRHPGSGAFSGQTGSATSGSTLPTTVNRALRHSGHAGRGADRFARNTAPAVHHRHIAGGTASGSGNPPSSGSSGVGSVLGSLAGLNGGGGLGAVLPIVLVLSAVWIGGVAIRRRRTG